MPDCEAARNAVLSAYIAGMREAQHEVSGLEDRAARVLGEMIADAERPDFNIETQGPRALGDAYRSLTEKAP